MTVLFLAEIAWGGLYQRPHHVAKAMASRWPVVWISPAALGGAASFQPRKVDANIYEINIPALPYNARHASVKILAKTLSYLPPVRWLFSLLQVRILKRILRNHPFSENPGHIAFIHNFHLLDAVQKLHPSLRIYDYIDNVFGFTSLPAHVKKLWIRTLTAADVVIVTSAKLREQVGQYRTQNVELIGNGVDFEMFSRKSSDPRPVDLPAATTLVGYIGAVYPWLDIELLESVCRKMPDTQFVFIGTVHPAIETRMHNLQKNHRNVHVLGFRPYATIPGYLRYFDVGIIPFLRDELTLAVNPVKLYEYSAAGKPTVATDFSDELHHYTSTLFIAKSHEDFVTCLHQALKVSRDPAFSARLREFAVNNDWKSKTQSILDIIDQRLSGK